MAVMDESVWERTSVEAMAVVYEKWVWYKRA
jgi:hypothetical protein